MPGEELRWYTLVKVLAVLLIVTPLSLAAVGEALYLGLKSLEAGCPGAYSPRCIIRADFFICIKATGDWKERGSFRRLGWALQEYCACRGVQYWEWLVQVEFSARLWAGLLKIALARSAWRQAGEMEKKGDAGVAVLSCASGARS